MNTIKIVDATIRQCTEGSTYPMSFKEKLEVAKIMDRLQVDVIELPRIAHPATDAILTKSIADVVNDAVVSCVVGNTVEDVKMTWKAIKKAAHPRLHIMLPTSPVQMEYISCLKPKKTIEMVETLVKEAKTLCSDVEFSAMDATRSEVEFLYDVLAVAVKAGANTVTLCDDAGVMLPEELHTFIQEAKDAVPSLNDVVVSVSCGDDLDMANANAFAAIANGATQVKSTVGGWNSPSLSSVVYAIAMKGDRLGVLCNVKKEQLQNTVKQLSWLTGNKNGTESVFQTSSSTDETAVSFDEETTMDEVSQAVKQMGYELTGEDNAKVYEAVKRVAQKKTVNLKELEAIVATSSLQVPPTYTLVDFVINSGNLMDSTAAVTLEKNGSRLKGLAMGDGPIEAALHAIEHIIGHHYELDDFQIRSVTEGSEAMGSTLIRLRYDGKLYSGSGVSIDIIGASIRAYINALNKIVYEREGEE